MEILRRKLKEKEEKAFTLIELLVVIIIIGILASVAIPLYMNQQKSAVDSATTSDVRNLATNVETLRTEKPVVRDFSVSEPVNGTSVLTVGEKTTEVSVSDGTQLAITAGDEGGTYIICGWNTDGDKYATEALVWDSNAGGLQENTGSTDDCGPVAPPASGGDGSGDGSGDGTEGEDGEGSGEEGTGGEGTEGDGSGAGNTNDSASGIEETEAPNVPGNAVVLGQRGGMATSLTAYPSSTAYSISWEAPEGPGVDEYVVEVYRSSANDPMDTSSDVLLGERTISGTETTAVIDTPFDINATRVRAVVVAANEAGESEASIGQRVAAPRVSGGLKGKPKPTYTKTYMTLYGVENTRSYGVTLTCLDESSNQIGEGVHVVSSSADTGYIDVPCMATPGVTQIRVDFLTYSDRYGEVRNDGIPSSSLYPFG